MLDFDGPYGLISQFLPVSKFPPHHSPLLQFLLVLSDFTIHLFLCALTMVTVLTSHARVHLSVWIICWMVVLHTFLLFSIVFTSYSFPIANVLRVFPVLVYFLLLNRQSCCLQINNFFYSIIHFPHHTHLLHIKLLRNQIIVSCFFTSFMSLMSILILCLFDKTLQAFVFSL